MKEKRRMGFSVAKRTRVGSSVHHVQRSSISITEVWPLGLAIIRSLMTVVRAAPEEWGVWKLDDRGFKKMRKKPSKYKASYDSVAVKRERSYGEGPGSIYTGRERTSTLVESKSVKSGEMSQASAGRQGACPKLEQRPWILCQLVLCSPASQELILVHDLPLQGQDTAIKSPTFLHSSGLQEPSGSPPKSVLRFGYNGRHCKQNITNDVGQLRGLAMRKWLGSPCWVSWEGGLMCDAATPRGNSSLFHLNYNAPAPEFKVRSSSMD